MKDVQKTNFDRENSVKRLRRRKRSMGLYGLIVIIFVLGIGITLSCTFLFNINEIKIKGSSDIYSSDDIIEKSGVKMGSNLIKLDTEEIRQRLLKFSYVENVIVEKDFPSTLDIEIEPCIPAFNISYKLGTILISEKGRVLEFSDSHKELPSFYGFEPLESKCGDMIDTGDKQKKEVFDEFIRVIRERENSDNIASVDMHNTSNVIITFRDGNVFKMGSWNDFEYKLTLAERVIQETGKIGYITMVGTNQCSFRTTDGSFSSNVITTEPAVTQSGTSTETTVSIPDDSYSENSEDSEYSDEIPGDYTEDYNSEDENNQSDSDYTSGTDTANSDMDDSSNYDNFSTEDYNDDNFDE